jgi:hypothetical protein
MKNKLIWIISGVIVLGGTIATIIYIKKKKSQNVGLGGDIEKPTINTTSVPISNLTQQTTTSKPKIDWAKFQKVYAIEDIYNIPTKDSQLGNMSVKKGVMFAYADKIYNLAHPLKKQILIKKNDNEYVAVELNSINEKNKIKIV